MKTRALGLLLLAACSDPPEVTCSTTALGRPHYVRSGVQVTLEAGISVSCFTNFGMGAPPRRAMATDVVVEVLDPDNRPVAATAAAPRHSGGSGSTSITTDVTFTVDRPGAWTVIARFEPNLGRVQFPVRTLAFRADAGFREVPVPDLPAACTAYGITASGTPVCVFPEPVGGGTVPVLAVGGQTFRGANFTIDGDAIWLTQPSVVRLVANDAGIWAGINQHPAGSARATVLGAADGHGYLANAEVTTTDLERLTPDPVNGGFATARVPFGLGRFVQAVAPGPNGLLVLGRSASSGQLALTAVGPDGGLQTTSAGSADTLPLAQDDGTLWLGRLTFNGFLQPEGTVTAFRRVGDALVSQSVESIGPATGFPPAALAPQTPLLRVAAEGDESWIVVPVLRSDDLGVESFVVGADYEEISSATRRHAFARSKDRKTLKIFDR